MDDNKQLSLSTPMNELEDMLINENNIDNLNDIIDLFNLNIKKKDIIRINKLNDLQDKIYSQMFDRISNKADEFSNKDLLEYFKTAQSVIDKSDTTLDNVNTPSIQINNQYNVTEEVLDKDSRDRVKLAVDSILQRLKAESENVVEAEIIEENEEESNE